MSQYKGQGSTLINIKVFFNPPDTRFTSPITLLLERGTNLLVVVHGPSTSEDKVWKQDNHMSL